MTNNINVAKQAEDQFLYSEIFLSKWGGICICVDKKIYVISQLLVPLT